MNIANGTYPARPKAASVYEAQSGALILAIVHAIDGGCEIKSYHALTTKDGAINTRCIDDLKKWSGWNGVDPYWFMDSDLTGIEVELVIENEPGFNDPTKTFPKVKWVNRPGTGGGAGLPEAGDRRAIIAKFGAKFRALAGPQPVAARKPLRRPGRGRRDTLLTLPPQPTTVQPPHAAPIKTATQNSAWARLNELGAGMPQGELEKIWFACVDSTGMDQADMTPDGWSKVTQAVEKHFAGLATEENVDEDPIPF